MNKKEQMNFNLNNFLLAMSNPLDAVKKDICNISNNHSKRVTFIALKFAEKLNLNPQEISDLCSYSLVHSNALFSTKVKNNSYFIKCEDNIKIFPFLNKKNNILKYQNEHYDGSGFFGIKANEIPLFSQLIAFADIIDSNFDLSINSIENRIEIIDFINKNKNKIFADELVNYFIEFSSSIDFWLDLQNENDILMYIFSKLHDFTMVLDFEQILEITTVFTKIVDENSKLLEKSLKMMEYYNFEHKDKQTFLIAASLQNIGKLFIPNKILSKNEKLNEIEYEYIKSYPYYTKKVLSNIMGFNDISIWAAKVQETLDGKGYPYALGAKDLSLKDRLMINLNIFESLTSQKDYREAFSKEDAIVLMNEMSQQGKLDKAIINDINEVL